MKTAKATSISDKVRKYATNFYLIPARRGRARTVSINVGMVHKALRLGNRVPLVCTALESQKFQRANQLKLISKTGPQSGQSTTVTYTYEFLNEPEEGDKMSGRQEAWNQLRGALKNVFAELGGGENYLRNERADFYGSGEDR